MTPLQMQHLVERAHSKAKANGFELLVGNDIEVVAHRPPYASGIKVAVLSSFELVICYFAGYEQMKLEQQELDRTAKVSK